MVRRDRHEDAPNSVSGRVVKTSIASSRSASGEADPGAGRLADPVALHQPDFLRPALQPVQRAQQLLGIGGDLEEPLRKLAALDHRAAAPAAAVNHLLVGEHGLVDRVPVDPTLLAVDQTALEHIQEHRLLMAIVGRIAGGDLARPVERTADRLHLVAHLGDIGVGPGRRDARPSGWPHSRPAGRTRPSPWGGAR